MDAYTILSFVFGLVVGASLGLTGGGGSIFAVPLLLYGLSVPVGVAMGLSLATVGVTAGFGAALRSLHGEVEWKAGLLFTLGGMITAPLGTSLVRQIHPAILLSAFAVLMLFVGWRMWWGRSEDHAEASRCVLKGAGQGSFGWECWLRLGSGGAAAGLLSGSFGVGGGFIVVPVLLFVTGMSIHSAVATSLLVIFLISISGVIAHVPHDQLFAMPLSVLFISGGTVGMLIGSRLRARLSGPTLQKIFAIGMWITAVWMLLKNATAFN